MYTMALKRLSASVGKVVSAHPEDQYHPPPGPPPNWRSPVIAVDIPQEEQSHHNTLPVEGWTKIWLPPESSAINTLFTASNQFFDSPQPEKLKKVVKAGTTEEGYFQVEGEKEYITLRRSDERTCPVPRVFSVIMLSLC